MRTASPGNESRRAVRLLDGAGRHGVGRYRRILCACAVAGILLSACGGSGGGGDVPPPAPDLAPDYGASSVSEQFWVAGTAVEPFTVPAAEGGDGTLGYSIDGLPPGVTMSSSREVSGTPTAAGAGEATVTARDTDGDEAVLTFRWTVRAPPLSVADAQFTTFESGQVRPLALSADGARLFAANTPDNRIEIFDVGDGGLSHAESVDVGLEPVALALRNDSELWVVNHLSDSVSIVDLGESPARVSRTLYVGDEPRDIVFAGPNGDRAFITAAHRGQNAPFDPQLTTPGVPRADVWVFDAGNLGAASQGQPLTIMHMFGDTPRGLAVSADGSRVYAAVFNSGNRTTTLFADIQRGGLMKPPPYENVEGIAAPATGLIVKFDGVDWVDAGDATTGVAPQAHNERVLFSLPDKDVFEIDAFANPPAATGSVSGVGTTLFNLAVNPTNNKLYVSNFEALNQVRFEGPGSFSTTVRGHLTESRITLVDFQSGEVAPRHLNKHITSYGEDAGTAEERMNSLAKPLEMAVSGDGATLYVAAFGSAKIGVLDAGQLEADTFTPSDSDHIALSAGGPSGLVLDEERGRLYVLTRFDNGISSVDTAEKSEIGHVRMYNPEPNVVVAGRPFLYDATFSSSRGDSACASCHIFGDMDHLAWDLGDPDGTVEPNPRDFVDHPLIPIGASREFHPMKGPMTTQSLRGLKGNGPMHWRGDRTGASADPDETLEEQAFEDFNVAFVGLVGREEQVSEEQMDAFARFALEITYPPNPIRGLDNSLTPAQDQGRDVYLNELTTGRGPFGLLPDPLLECNICHEVDPPAGKFGTGGLMSTEGDNIVEEFKVPHLRNMYQKVGMFGSLDESEEANEHKGPQIRGFGFAHDGSVDTISSFLGGGTFEFDSEQEKANVIDFVFAMDAELAPIVGQQVTLSASMASAAALARFDLLVERAMVMEPRPECDLIGKGVLDGEARGALLSGGVFSLDRAADPTLTPAQMTAEAQRGGNAFTFTCVPPGNGTRMGLDRDLDGVHDMDERDAGTDPALRD